MAEKILIINDDISICDLLKSFLSQKGYEIREAYDGLLGIQATAEFSPDLILMDVMMPNLNGYETCQKLKQDPKTNNIPIIFLSSLNESADKIKGLEVGGVDFVNKVTDWAELLARVKTHLSIRALNNELILRNRELHQKQNRIEEDLAAAANIQKSLLPQKINGSNLLEISWRCQPCDQIGGDIFNVLQADKDHMILYILDVCGHGVPSAMVTVSVTQQLLLQNSFLKLYNDQKILSPKEVLKSLEHQFPFERFNKFFTLFYMTLNLKDLTICYSNAGHPPAVILHANKEFELLENGGTVVGINESGFYQEEKKKLMKGDKIILYTDGIIECQNQQEEFFGPNRFYSILERNKHQPINTLVETVQQSLQEFANGAPSYDDVSILGIQI